MTTWSSPRILLGLTLLTASACQHSTQSVPPAPEPALAAIPQDERPLHERILTLDTHKDIPDALATRSKSDDPEAVARHARRFDPTVDGDSQVDFPKMRDGGYDCAFFIVYVGQGRNDGAGFVRAKKQAMLKFTAIQRMLGKHYDHVELARTAADVQRIHDAGKLVACIGIENGYPMGENLDLIEEFHWRGARYMGITHNRHNQLGDSHTPVEPEHGGLTDLGRQAVAKMNEVGIMVDISHSSKATMMDILATTKAPVIASHSGCRDVFDHSRNLDDEQLRALAKNGGVIQVVGLGAFLRDQESRKDAREALREELGLPSRWDLYKMQNEGTLTAELEAKVAVFETRAAAIDEEFPEANVEDVVDHIEHAVKICGIDHVGIGSDFDGGGGVSGWNNARETPNVTEAMLRRGLSEDEIQKIWSGNLLRVWSEVEDVAKSIAAPR